MILTFKAVSGRIITTILGKRSASDTEFGILGESLHQKLEVVRLKRKIAVQIPDYVKVNRPDTLQPGVKSTHLAGKVSVKMLWAPHQFDPR